MAWEWSHTPEAYANARRNLGRLDDDLRVIWAEWEAYDGNDFDDSVYPDALARAEDIPHDVLADRIWEQMEEQATCDNGGWRAWACPFGCHTVSFDEE